MEKVNLLVAFGAGLLSFLSPCILPLIPGYLGFISGLSLEELKNQADSHQKIWRGALFFTAGFSLVFILLGTSMTFLGSFLNSSLFWLNKIAGLFLILLGLNLLGVFKLKIFNLEKKFHLKKVNGSHSLAFLLGCAFAFGWSPCIGPILASILVIAANQQTALSGALLLTAYSAGLAVPFLLTALAINKFLTYFTKIKKALAVVTFLTGFLLLLIGGLLLSGNFGGGMPGL